jgi:hypothetical protein
MTRDDIIRMAREAWGEGAVYRFDSPKHWPEVEEMFVRFAALVAAAERESCKRCEAYKSLIAALEKELSRYRSGDIR